MGRLNASGKSSINDERRMHRDFYSSVHRCAVTDVFFERGKIRVRFLDGGTPLEVPIPLIGFSVPPDKSGEINERAISWGVYYPQVNDIVLVGFAASGEPYTLGYHTISFSELTRIDDAYEEKGGIGWGTASGKRLRPGDWTFKSGRNSALYLGDKAQLSSGPHSIVLDPSTVNGQIAIKSPYLHSWYGTSSERREGAARRILVEGVDTQERPIVGTFGVQAQEHTNFVKRSTVVNPGGQIMVHFAEGEVIDETLKQIMIPAIAYSDLAVALTGTGTRIFRAVKDDAVGKIDMFAELVDNLGNYGVSAKTAQGFQWFTPAATWTVLNKTTTWTSSLKFDVTSLSISMTSLAAMLLTSTTTMGLTSGGAMKLTAPSISLASGSISFGASPAKVSVLGSLTFDATSINLGNAATEYVVKGTMFKTALDTFLAAVAAAAATATSPSTTTSAVQTIGGLATAFKIAIASMLSTTVRTQ